MIKDFNKKTFKLITIGIIITIVTIFGIAYHYSNLQSGHCNRNNECVNTCCGCININDKCDIECEFLPERKCECVDGECGSKSEEETEAKVCKIDEDCIVFGTDGDCSCGCFHKNHNWEAEGSCNCVAPDSCECVEGKCEGVLKEGETELGINILKEGEGIGTKNGDSVSVHYVGTLENGTKFDSSIDRGQPFIFTLGAGKVISGWEIGVLGMKIGEKRKLTIPPELGYGKTGVPGVIPPDSVLIFEVELLGIN